MSDVLDHETGRVDDSDVADLDTEQGAKDSLRQEAKEKAKSPCQCAAWTIAIDTEEQTTGCDGGLTTRDFIRGHDSKLKSLLIKAGEADWYTETSAFTVDGGIRHERSWKDAAALYGFSSQVEEAVAKRHEKLEEKAERARVRQEAREAKAEEAAAKKAEREAAKQASKDDARAETETDRGEETPELSQDEREANWDWNDTDSNTEWSGSDDQQ